MSSMCKFGRKALSAIMYCRTNIVPYIQSFGITWDLTTNGIAAVRLFVLWRPRSSPLSLRAARSSPPSGRNSTTPPTSPRRSSLARRVVVWLAGDRRPSLRADGAAPAVGPLQHAEHARRAVGGSLAPLSRSSSVCCISTGATVVSRAVSSTTRS